MGGVGLKIQIRKSPSRLPMNRWGKSEEISALTAFLISDLSSYITGETINIDGGWTHG